MKDDTRALLVAFVVCVIWGSTFISTKLLIMNGLSPAQIFTLRFILAWVLMLCFDHKRLWSDSLRDELLLVGLGITGGSVYFFPRTKRCAIPPPPTFRSSVCSCPLVTTLLYRLVVRGSRLGRQQLAGALLAFFGMAAVVLNGRFVLHLSPLGDTLALLACLCWAVYSILMKYISGRYSSVFITRKVFFYGLLTVLPYYIYRPEELSMQPLWQLSAAADRATVVVWGNLIYLGCVASMLCYLAWTWAIGRLGVVRTTNFVYVNPIATVVLAVIVLGERITPWFLCGAAMILLGLYLELKDKNSR